MRTERLQHLAVGANVRRYATCLRAWRANSPQDARILFDRRRGISVPDAYNAWAFREYSEDYVAQHDEARSARRGVWQTETQKAKDYRVSMRNVGFGRYLPGGKAR